MIIGCHDVCRKSMTINRAYLVMWREFDVRIRPAVRLRKLRKHFLKTILTDPFHSGHVSSSSLTVRPSVGWRSVGAISDRGSRTKRRRCRAGWGMVRVGLVSVRSP